MLLRAAVHVHSEWSYDGAWPLSKIAVLFGRLGYHIVLTSEHDKLFDESRWTSYREACIQASTERVLIIPGIEYSDKTNTLHLLAWGELPFLGKEQETDQLLNRINELNGLAVLAHPSRKNALQLFDARLVPLLLGVEQWNRKVDGVAPSKEAAALLAAHKRLIPFVGLDFHRANQIFPLAVTVDVKGDVSEKNVLSALRERRCCPDVFSMPTSWFLKGIGGITARTIERSRRFIAKTLK